MAALGNVWQVEGEGGGESTREAEEQRCSAQRVMLSPHCRCAFWDAHVDFFRSFMGLFGECQHPAHKKLNLLPASLSKELMLSLCGSVLFAGNGQMSYLPGVLQE